MVSTASRAGAYAAMDAALLDLRRVWMHPRLLRWFAKEVGADVELATLRTLRAIEAAGTEPLGVSDLAAAVAVDVSTASRLVEQAVAEGYVARRSSAHDRRRTELTLTGDGEQLLAHATEVRAGLMGRATRDWDDEDLLTLAELLSRLQLDLRGLLHDEECP